MKLYFATGNKHKLNEVQKMLSAPIFDIRAMSELGFSDEIEEWGSTLEENANIKARFIHEKYKVNVFAEDTGLEVTVLDGAPGVRTARYAGDNKNANENMDFLLENLKGEINRSAKFRTIITLILNDKEFMFEGFINGVITKEKQGDTGFGYDPIFIPNGYNKTFAELNSDIKNSISHRYRAMSKLISFLKTTRKNQGIIRLQKIKLA